MQTLLKFKDKKIFYWLLFSLIIFAWWRFRLMYLTPRSGDAWIYWYAGKEILEGEIPYRDFFYSSPPLIPYFTALWQWLFGFNLKIALVVPHLLNMFSATLIFAFFNSRKQLQAGLIAAIAFLFTGVIFSHADFLLGSTILTPFIILGFIFFERRNFLFSGMFFGLAALTKLYGIVPAIFLLPLFKNWKDFFRFFLGGFITFGVPNLIFWPIVGNEYLDLIFFNHFQKPITERAFAFWGLLKYDSALIITLFTGIWLQRKKALFKSTVLASTGILIFFALSNEVFYGYFQPLAAILAILLGYLTAEKNNFLKKFILSLILTTLAFNSIFGIRAYYKNDSQVASIPNFGKMVETVRKETDPDDQIYGIGTLVPLLALETNRQFFGNNFDTLSKWNYIGLFSIQDKAVDLQQAKVPLVISNNNYIKTIRGENKISLDSELLPKKFLLKNCRILSKFGYNEFTFWKCFEQ